MFPRNGFVLVANHSLASRYSRGYTIVVCWRLEVNVIRIPSTTYVVLNLVKAPEVCSIKRRNILQ
jgi:hypothetical protein